MKITDAVGFKLGTVLMLSNALLCLTFVIETSEVKITG